MKLSLNISLVIITILAIVFGFVLFYQREQNKHYERLHESTLAYIQQPQKIEVILVKEKLTVKETIIEAIKSALAFLLSVFGKL